MAQRCIGCRKSRKTKKGLCAVCRRKEAKMRPFRATPANEIDGIINGLKTDLNK